VTADNADVLGVDWEPDGRHLVFSSERAGGIGLWRIDASSADESDRPMPTLLAGGGAKLKHPSVARRTGIVAYEEWQYEINLRERAIDPQAPEADARSVAATADRWNFHPQLAPDGRHLVFQSTRSGQYELWLSDPDGNHARPLTRSAAYKSLARWSPDSRRLAFTMRTDAGFALMMLDVDAGTSRTLATNPSGLVAPSWSHDGTAVYAGLLDGEGWQVWRLDATTGDRRRITTDGGYAAIESADGRWLYVARLDRAGLWRRAIDGGAESLVAERVRAEQWPNWSLGARGVYYLTWPDDGDPQVALVEDGSTTPQLLARLPDYAWPGVTITRDGTRIIYAHADRRTANIGGLQIGR
jgi:WD40 repeat protein